MKAKTIPVLKKVRGAGTIWYLNYGYNNTKICENIVKLVEYNYNFIMEGE